MTQPKPPSKPPVPPEPPRATRAFLDGLEEGMARLLVEDEHGEWRTYHLPAAALPADSKEGSWLELAIRSIAPPPEFKGPGPREKLGHSDRGGNFSL